MNPMRSHRRRSLPSRAGASVIALALLLSLAPTPAAGATLSEKMAEAARAEQELAAMRIQVGTLMADYDRANNELEAARLDLADTTERLKVLDAEIAHDQAILDRRAISMYKSGGLAELEVLLGTSSLRDLIEQMVFVGAIIDSDTRMLSDMKQRRDESARLRAQQEQFEARAMMLRQVADARRAQMEEYVQRQEALTKSLSAEVAVLLRQQQEADALAAALRAAGGYGDGSPPPVPFNPNTIISEPAFLASNSMDAPAIQAFLNAQAGSLKSYSGRDHNGATRTAAEMIAEAAAAWGVSPKVIIVTLQKEQSLISRPNPTKYALDWAMGCGKAESYTIESYRGFGNQIWHGARVLMKNRAGWKPGAVLPIDGAAVYPTNAATHTLYRYTPHFAGNVSFWRLYWRYFGDPMK